MVLHCEMGALPPSVGLLVPNSAGKAERRSASRFGRISATTSRYPGARARSTAIAQGRS